ncbi:MAG: nucleotidyltransferase domain-containing protein [Chitinophagaceae bacterium]
MKNKPEKISNNEVVSWDVHLDKKYGEHGTVTRSEFEITAQAFILGELAEIKTKNNMLLREKDKLALLDIFETNPSPIEVWAYGSPVKGGAHNGSDLDLVVRTPDLKPLSQKEFNGLFEKIEDSNIPILVELGAWARLPDSFHKNILAQYEVLFSSLVVDANVKEG